MDDSLRRLNTDYIDLYFAHWPDPETPVAETLDAFHALQQAGKIRAMGASNLDAQQLSGALEVSRKSGLPAWQVLQPEYNLYHRSAFEGALCDLCISRDIGVVTYYSLASGFLTGKYRQQSDLAQSQRGEASANISILAGCVLSIPWLKWRSKAALNLPKSRWPG